MPRVFNETGALRPARTRFDLSHEHKLTCDMGQLIPIGLVECVPGDTMSIKNQLLVRLQPLAAPLMETIDAYIHWFFVPYRILDDNWEEFITGGKLGTYDEPPPRFVPVSSKGDTAKYTLWDYFGFPIGVYPTENFSPLAYPWRAYNMIWNEFYRDENLTDEVAEDNNRVLRRSWTKDYFSSALPFQQRGIAPSVPLSGTAKTVFTIPPAPIGSASLQPNIGWYSIGGYNSAGYVDGGLYSQWQAGGGAISGSIGSKGDVGVNTGLNKYNSVDVSQIGTFDASDLRNMFQIQKWMERNARGGYRYTEFLGQHFGVSPNDSRLDRPEYIGGMRTPIIVSEVLQTSASVSGGSPQGNMSGKGISAGDEFIGKYYVEEFGVLMGIMSVMPRPSYQQGIPRNWLRRTRYDFYFPEFSNLSEQAIEEAEIYLQASDVDNERVFGFQGRYDELRIMPNTVHADMRDTFDYWHLGRKFTSAPNLSQAFVECNPRKDIFLVQDEHGLLVQVANLIDAVRPMPSIAEPGLIDHH